MWNKNNSALVVAHDYALHKKPEICIKQIRRNQKDIPFYFLGKNFNNCTPNCNLVQLRNDSIKAFEDNYVHRSPNSKKQAIIALARYFYILEFMKKENLDYIFHLDSDVLWFSSLEEMKSVYDLTGWGAIKIDQNDPDHMWHINGGTSFFSFKLLKEFTEFLSYSFSNENFEPYKKKWRAYQENNKLGGISDMTALYLFWRDHKSTFTNLVKVKNDTVFDHCLNLGFGYYRDQFEVKGDMKKIKFVENKPYCYDTYRNKWIRFHALHCHGVSNNIVAKLGGVI